MSSTVHEIKLALIKKRKSDGSIVHGGFHFMRYNTGNKNYNWGGNCGRRPESETISFKIEKLFHEEFDQSTKLIVIGKLFNVLIYNFKRLSNVSIFQFTVNIFVDEEKDEIVFCPFNNGDCDKLVSRWLRNNDDTENQFKMFIEFGTNSTDASINVWI